MCTALTAIGLVPSEQLAVELLALAYVAPFGVATAALAYGAAAGDKTIGRTATTILTAGFAVGLGGLGGVLAGAVGTAVGATTQGAVLPAVVVSLATTGALLALRAPWQRSLERRLDPDRAAVRSWISGTDAADVLEALRRLDAGAAPRGAPDATAALASLSPREREVLDLLSRGLSNAAIAAVLVVSERTVDTHVRSIFGKLDLGVDSAVNRRVQAAAHWIRASTGTTDSGASTDARRRDPS
jgi:DNA-binding CsgD family transcriptional regulator